MTTEARNKHLETFVLEPKPPKIEVINSLGIATELLEKGGDLRPYKTWMPVSTNKKKYPDGMVVQFAEWAADNSEGCTIVVSDWLHRYNMIAEGRLSWMDFMDWDKPIRELDRDARNRVKKLQELLADRGASCRVVKWTDLLFDEIRGESEDNYHMFNIAQEYLSIYIDEDHPNHIPEFAADVAGIAPVLIPFYIERLVRQGRDKKAILFALKEYGKEEIFLTELMAKTSRANIKVGPPWERVYDEISAKYISGHYFGGEDSDRAPFGAVYLSQKES